VATPTAEQEAIPVPQAVKQLLFYKKYKLLHSDKVYKFDAICPTVIALLDTVDKAGFGAVQEV
jgi:hypothetical protein